MHLLLMDLSSRADFLLCDLVILFFCLGSFWISAAIDQSENSRDFRWFLNFSLIIVMVITILYLYGATELGGLELCLLKDLKPLGCRLNFKLIRSMWLWNITFYVITRQWYILQIVHLLCFSAWKKSYDSTITTGG